MYLIRKVLSDETIEKINSLKPHLVWEDGNNSFDGPDGLKNCQQAIQNYPERDVESLIFADLNKDKQFLGFTAAEKSTDIIISRYGEGMYYHPHHDVPASGHFSTTLFLNEGYEGGELNLWNNGDVRNIKLPTGWAVTYDTGVCHSVSKVTKGTRDVAIFWTTSLIKNAADRDLHYKLTRISNAIHTKYGDSEVTESVEEAKENPQFMIKEMIYSIIRNHVN